MRLSAFEVAFIGQSRIVGVSVCCLGIPISVRGNICPHTLAVGVWVDSLQAKICLLVVVGGLWIFE